MMSSIEIKKVSITELDTDAIVNAANEGLWAGGGVCGAIFKAAGFEPLQAACSKIGHCDTGSAVITPGFNLKARYIIHAVGPRWTDGKHQEPELLYGAYCKALELALKNGCSSVGFPLISAGIFGYPLRDAWCTAFRACGDFLNQQKEHSLDIIFAVLSDEILEEGRKALRGSSASRYKAADRYDWTRVDMPDQHETFIFQRPFTKQQMAALRRGNIPKAMEDKWFWFMEGDTLYAHRSWTGYCIYRIDFKPDHNHVVTVNRNPEQFSSSSTAEDAQQLNDLLNWWTQGSYDYYHEWLAETLTTLKKQKKEQDPETAQSEQDPIPEKHQQGQVAGKAPSPKDARKARIEIFNDTLQKCQTDPDLIAAVAASKKKTRVYYENEYPALTAHAQYETEIVVSKKRSYQAAMDLKQDQPDARVAVLNFANAFHPGGGVKTGAGAQEECLCRCSTLYPLLYRKYLKGKYYDYHSRIGDPKATDAVIYTKDVVIFKTDTALPEMMEKGDWVCVDVMTCAAPDLRQKSNPHVALVGSGAVMNHAELFGYHVRRAIHLLTVAAAEGADTLVLGAFGCGAFQNDPAVVARACRTALQEFQGFFRKIEFAVYCPPGNEENYLVFSKEFS